MFIFAVCIVVIAMSVFWKHTFICCSLYPRQNLASRHSVIP